MHRAFLCQLPSINVIIIIIIIISAMSVWLNSLWSQAWPPRDYHDQVSVDLWLCRTLRHTATLLACAMTSADGTCGGLKLPALQNNLVTIQP